MLVVGIDAGHGGGDPGAVWPLFVCDRAWNEITRDDRFDEHLKTVTHRESNLTLCLARYLHARIGHSGEPIKPVLLRQREEETLPQNVRGALSSAAACKMVLSIHFNSGAPAQRGAECYYWPGNLRMRAVGDSILEAMPPPLYRHGKQSYAAEDRPGREDDWMRRPRYVLGAHSCDVILVEVGYLSRAEDREAIGDPATQSCICSALEVGVARYRQLIESPHLAGL